MLKVKLQFTLISALMVLAIISCQRKNETSVPATSQTISNDSLVKRGGYLIAAMGCDDCHSPKKMGANGPELDMENRFAGFMATHPLPKLDVSQIKNGWVLFNNENTASIGPWGISYASNISGDSTGIGNWTEAQFIKAFTQGKWMGLEGTRTLLPPMPWQSFSKLQGADVKAIFAYLKASKPVHNIVPEPKDLSKL